MPTIAAIASGKPKVIDDAAKAKAAAAAQKVIDDAAKVKAAASFATKYIFAFDIDNTL